MVVYETNFVQSLIADLSHSDIQIAYQAKASLAEYSDEALPYLLDAMLRAQGRAAWLAASILAERRDLRLQVYFVDLLQAPELMLRQIAVSALGKLGDKRSTIALCHALFDSSLIVQIATIQALMQINDARAARPILHLLKTSPSPSVQAIAIEALKELGDFRLYGVIRNFTRSSDPQVSMKAQEFLEKFA